MRVLSLHLYPVKSCRGLSLTRARVGRRGLDLDRRWMVVDEAGTFLTQRDLPRLALVDVQLEGEGLMLSAPGHGAMAVPATPDLATLRRGRNGQPGPVKVRVWKSEVEAVDCGDAAAHWLGSWLGRPARLVAMPDDAERGVDPTFSRPGDIVGFADGFPVLLTTRASLDDLSARLGDAGPVPMDRFRPNVVVDGEGAWDEDAWRRVLVGPIPLRVSKPCGRCTVITIDQHTGHKTGVEPLRTLSTFRQQTGAAGSSVVFGQNLIPDAEGWLTVGDEVSVVERGAWSMDRGPRTADRGSGDPG